MFVVEDEVVDGRTTAVEPLHAITVQGDLGPSVGPLANAKTDLARSIPLGRKPLC